MIADIEHVIFLVTRDLEWFSSVSYLYRIDAQNLSFHKFIYMKELFSNFYMLIWSLQVSLIMFQVVFIFSSGHTPNASSDLHMSFSIEGIPYHG